MLPPAVTEEAFAALCRDEAALRPGVDRLCQRLGVDTSRLARYPAGSRPVYAAGDLVLKLFPPVPAWPGWRVEAGALAAVQGRLPVSVPRVHAAGDHDGWGYADEPPAWRPAGYRMEPGANRGLGPAGGSVGRDNRGAAPGAAASH